MRTEELTAGWLAQGRVPGAGVCDVRREVALPFLLADLCDACGREGLFLRASRMRCRLSFLSRNQIRISDGFRFLTLKKNPFMSGFFM